jgi:hypothetical protein
LEDDVTFTSGTAEYKNFFSVAYYETVIQSNAETVLEHGRSLIGLEPWSEVGAARIAPSEAELDAAERFVASRLLRTGFGFLTLRLSEPEWEVIAESHQRPDREARPLPVRASQKQRSIMQRRSIIDVPHRVNDANEPLAVGSAGHVVRS